VGGDDPERILDHAAERTVALRLLEQAKGPKGSARRN
jgi:hypothetical protein